MLCASVLVEFQVPCVVAIATAQINNIKSTLLDAEFNGLSNDVNIVPVKQVVMKLCALKSRFCLPVGSIFTVNFKLQ